DYDGVLLDAYGVLNDAGGALPGAAGLIDDLDRRSMPYLVVTNDASRLPETLARRFHGLGLGIPADRILTSGLLLDGWFAGRDLQGAATVVLGTPESAAYVERAGGVVVPNASDAELDVLCVSDDSGFDFLPG